MIAACGWTSVIWVVGGILVGLGYAVVEECT
jgi:hypothetical protein